MKRNNELRSKYRQYLIKAVDHLEKSFLKAQKLPTQLSVNSDDSLETWESFTARFARVVDLFMTKYLRVLVLDDDPGFEGSLRDVADRAEKLNLIDSANEWLDRRELRNIQAHDYTDEEFERFVKLLLEQTPAVITIRKLL